MSIGVGSKNTSHYKSGLWELLLKHSHEWNTSSFSEANTWLSVEFLSIQKAIFTFDATCIEFSSHSGNAGQFHPFAENRSETVTLEPYGGFSSRSFLICCFACSGSPVGGSLRERVKLVKGLSTFPAVWESGSPAAPMIERYGLHVRLR